MFAVMKTFITVISASTGRNDFIFDIWLWHGGGKPGKGRHGTSHMPKPYIKYKIISSSRS
jgi:hypothetical protein